MTLSAVGNLPGNVRWLSICIESVARNAGGLVMTTVLDHHQASLRRIRTEGYVQFWMQEFRLYLAAAARQFSPGRDSLTERVLNR